MHANALTEGESREIIRLCHAGLESHALRREVFDRLQRVMPSANFWCAATDPTTLLYTSAIVGGFEPPQPHVVPAYLTNEFLQDDYNKFSDLARLRRPVSTLWAATAGDLAQSVRYREIHEPAGLRHEMRAVFQSGGATWGVACLHRSKRDPDFTSADVAFLAGIAPHLAAGLRAALLLDAAESAPTADGPGLALVADDLSVVAITPAAEVLLEEVDDWPRGEGLPQAVMAVVARLRALEREPEVNAAIPSVRLRTRAGRWLMVQASRLSGRSAAVEHVAVTIEQASPLDIAPLVLQAYELTAREVEVATLVIQGYATDAISTQLCISTLTVQQHLKAIFDKVGVRSRRELVAHVFTQSYWPLLAHDHGMAADAWRTT